MSYTKGEWKKCLSSEWTTGIADKNNIIIAETFRWKDRPRDEMEANARLIASAPDLLEACKASLAYVNDDYEGSIDDLIYVLQQAINKAERKA